MINCPNCGLELRPDSSNPQRMKCTNCNYALDAMPYVAPNAQSYAAAPSASYAAAPAVSAPMPGVAAGTGASAAVVSDVPFKKPVSGLAVTALVLGILALICCWVPVVSFAGFVLGLCGLVFGIVALVRMKNNAAAGKGMAIAGTICAAIALIVALIMSIFSVFLVNAVVKDSDFYRNYVYDFMTLLDDDYYGYDDFSVRFASVDSFDYNTK